MEYPVIIDYLTVCIKISTFDEAINFLGLDESGLSFDSCAGYNFFKYGMTYNNEITILMDNYSDPDLCCFNISGRGCRDMESFSSVGLFGFIKRCKLFGGSFSRVDLAMDIIDDSFSISTLVNATRHGNFKCRSKFYNIMESCDDGICGSSLYFGKQKSNLYINIYDKRAERGFTPEDMPNWTRIECRLRHENAETVISALLKEEIGIVFSKVMNNYLTFLTPSKTDSNKRRWATAKYWQRFIDAVEPIKMISSVGVEYDFGKFEKYLFTTCGSSIKAYLEMKPLESLLNGISDSHLNARQKMIIDNYIDGIDYMLLID